MFIKKASIDNIVQAIVDNKPDYEFNLMISLAEQNSPDVKELIVKLNEMNISFYGGLYPSLAHNKEKFDEGVLLNFFPSIGKPFLIKGLNEKNHEMPDFTSLMDSESELSAIIIVDGLSNYIVNFLTDLYNILGNSINYFGGGAGSLSLEQKPCIFTNDGFHEACALICPIPLKSILGVKHGWERIAGPFVASKTDKNLIMELNWQPAFEVYKEIVDEASNDSISKDNFFSIAKCFPFGMYKDHSERIARVPVNLTEEGYLMVLGEVPQNNVLEILKGNPDNLIAAATAAAKESTSGKTKIKDALVFDCISRVLFLDDKVGEELSAIQNVLSAEDSDAIFEGPITMGEISSFGKGTIEFFNKTIVTGVLYE